VRPPKGTLRPEVVKVAKHRIANGLYDNPRVIAIAIGRMLEEEAPKALQPQEQ